MRRIALVAALAAAWPAVALAQPNDGVHGGMDDGSDLPPMLRNPRQVSGVPRAEQSDPPGSLIIRAAQGSFRKTEFGEVVADFPEGGVVYLVGIGTGGKLTLRKQALDKSGRAKFTGLVRNGSEVYFALATFERPGKTDRLQSRLVTMPPEVGMRMMLAGPAVDSDAPAADDVLGPDIPEDQIPAPGTVVVALDGQTESVDEVEVVDVESGEAVAAAKPTGTTSYLRPSAELSEPKGDSTLKPGVVSMTVTRRRVPLTAVDVELWPVTEGDPAGEPLMRGSTDGQGRVTFEGVETGQKLQLQLRVHGRKAMSEAFEMGAEGGMAMTAKLDWQEIRSLEATVAGLPTGGDRVYVARTVTDGKAHISPPFQLTAERGARTQVLVYSGVLMGFHGGGQLNDETMGFQLQLAVINPSLVPFDPGKKGLAIPLPKGFSGAGVNDEIAHRVKVDDKGLVWRGAIPPGERSFIAGFGMPVEDGVVEMVLPLPYGAFNSQLVVEDLPGVTVTAPSDVNRKPDQRDGRQLIVFSDIQRRPGEELALRFANLPSRPAWQIWLRNGVGLTVVALMGWAIFGVVMRFRRRSALEHLEIERDNLMVEMVRLESDLAKKRIAVPEYRRRRAQTLGRLETVYARLAQATDDQTRET